MRYRIHEIKLNIDEPFEMIPRRIERKLRLKENSLNDSDYFVMKESIDARDKKDIKYVYTVDFDANINLDKVQIKNFGVAPNIKRVELKRGERFSEKRPVVIGFGPCGMFAALELARYNMKPIVIERGSKINKRVKKVEEFWKDGILDEESNVLFGEGGAGTFSDGKLTTGIRDSRIRYVLETLVEAGAPADILYKQKPHIGTDLLRLVVRNIRNQIIELGGEIRFNTKMQRLNLLNDEVLSVITSDDEVIYTDAVIVAIGHSARDTFKMFDAQGIKMEQKPFSIGVRIEHSQDLIDKAQYGNTKGLPPAEYKLSYKAKNGRGVYSFCMCPGGEVITTTTKEGEISVNGMSYRKRDSGAANSGILCDVRCTDFESDDVLAGIEFQRKYEKIAFMHGGENFKPPKSNYMEFLHNIGEGSKVNECLPDFAKEAIKEAIPKFGKKIKGFDSKETIIKAVETRSSSPVRIVRNEKLESNIKGLFPGGEGAGYAGGITSAACDGLKIAERIIIA